MAVQEVFAYLCVDDADAAIRFYREAFGATEKFRLVEPGGRVGHAELDFDGATLMLADEFPEIGVPRADRPGPGGVSGGGWGDRTPTSHGDFIGFRPNKHASLASLRVRLCRPWHAVSWGEPRESNPSGPGSHPGASAARPGSPSELFLVDQGAAVAEAGGIEPPRPL